MNYHRAIFLQSAAQLAQLPPDEGIEVAFIGRSNAGKSSAINTITQQKQLARTSKTPGRTQLINLFGLDDIRRIVDLPGYGFAQVALSIKERWQKTLALYLEKRQCLCGVILLMDIRHPLNTLDSNMLGWCIARALPVHILLTKADKLSRNQSMQVLNQLKQSLAPHAQLVSIQLFSSHTRVGLQEVNQQLDTWFQFPNIES